MKANDFATHSMLNEKGYHFHCWFEKSHVYKKQVDDGTEYLFVNFLTNRVLTTLKLER